MRKIYHFSLFHFLIYFSTSFSTPIFNSYILLTQYSFSAADVNPSLKPTVSSKSCLFFKHMHHALTNHNHGIINSYKCDALNLLIGKKEELWNPTWGHIHNVYGVGLFSMYPKPSIKYIPNYYQLSTNWCTEIYICQVLYGIKFYSLSIVMNPFFFFHFKSTKHI